MIGKVFALTLVILFSVVTVDLIHVQSKDNKCIQLGGTPSKGICVKLEKIEVK